MFIVKHTMFYVYTSLLNNIYYVFMQLMYTLHIEVLYYDVRECNV